MILFCRAREGGAQGAQDKKSSFDLARHRSYAVEPQDMRTIISKR